MSFVRLLAAATVAWAIAAPALAAPPLWTVDKAASRLGFAGEVSGQAFTGVFRRWDASIRFDPNDLAHSSVSASIDMTSFATGSADRDALLPDPDWFWTSHFPRATFVATRFRVLAPGRYAADGVLTLRGVAKPLTLPFALAVSGASAKMTASVGLNRLAFGVGQGEWKATDTVPAAVAVTVDLTARRAR
ncbi:MAG TPA: YceI family protein [Caulobacteraceae bacterium]|nr:YceI family protein [Caulobacteraceae bacterium]